MVENARKIDMLFTIAVITLTVAGFFIFSSASLGLLTRNGPEASSIAFNQTLGLILGLIGFFIVSRIRYTFWKKHSLVLLIAACILNAIIFIPGVGIEHGGATRWIDIRFISFQPSEILKISYIIYLAAWLGSIKERIRDFKTGIIPFCGILAIVSAILIAQSDTYSMIVTGSAAAIMLIVAGARLKHLAILGLIGISVIAMIVASRPYTQQRIMTFINPSNDPRGTSYQLQQSLIAIGSGGLTGRGFGQSIQKFFYLPEPIGDSIFAVQAEEFGFIGSVILISLYLFFAMRSLKIASHSPDMYGGLLIVGIVILVVVESFINIAAMLGIIPLTGKPLLFVSHGGTALMIILTAMGLIANVSRYQKKLL